MSATRIQFNWKQCANSYIIQNIKNFVDEKIEEDEDFIKKAAELSEENRIEGLRDIYYDDVGDLIVNTDHIDRYNFWKCYQFTLDTNIRVVDVIDDYAKCEKWFIDEYGEESRPDIQGGSRNSCTNILPVEKFWNNLIYWYFKSQIDEHFEYFTDYIDEKIEEYKETLRYCRLSCGICYNNKIVYTGCSCCNGNYICKTCYDKLENVNECPFCRCEEMVKDDYLPDDNEDYDNWILKIARVLNDIPKAVENLIMETCERCECKIRWRNKVCVIQEELEEDEITEEFVCKDCYKDYIDKNKNPEGYKTLDECTPDGQDFQDWIFRKLRIHDRIRK